MQQAPNPPPPAYSKGSAWANTKAGATTTWPSGLLPPGPACQPCPDCGGLTCLCRPRFFAGQLLTEQDLNRLDQYIVAKNQLHNRYLVGHGVVCGLEVKCSPCANTVSVSSGYAIDTCGNDIIVCSPDTVDICKLIKACTPTTQVDCAPYKDTTRCRDMDQEWILAIRYQETPSRGVTPLTGAAQCGCATGGGSCSCGSAVSKACGCGSMKPAASCCGQTMTGATPVSTNLPRRGAPLSCEPTVTCEAYRYEVFLAPNPPRRAPVRSVYGIGGLSDTIHGEMAERIACCWENFVASIPLPPAAFTLPSIEANPKAWSAYCCELRHALIQYLMAQGGTDCEAIARLRAIDCPPPNRVGELVFALWEEARIVAEVLTGCICSAALPPCPEPGDPRVPLASVKVRASDCAILSVCDWTPLRKNVVTNRTLGYWLGWLPFVPILREFMEEMCCKGFGLPPRTGGATGDRLLADRETADARELQAAAPAGGTAGQPSQQPLPSGQGLDTQISFGARYEASNPISNAIAFNLAGGVNTLSAGDLLQALFDPVDPTDPVRELADTPHAKVLAEIVRPLIASLAPLFNAASGNPTAPTGTTQTGTAPTGTTQTGTTETVTPTTSATETGTTETAATLAALRAELDALKATVTTQQAALDALRSPPAPTKTD